MLPFVLILLSVHSIQQIACDFLFKNDDLYEGDPCFLNDRKIGQCRKISECGTKHAKVAPTCAFVGNEPIICCDVIQRHCENITASESKITDHLVGNTKTAEVGEFPFMALVTYKEPTLRCGATLVSRRFLLTAAHCIKNKVRSEPVAVHLGTNDADDPEADTFRIKKTYIHDRYTPNIKQNDIAIIELEEEVPLNHRIKPICLYTNQEDLLETDELVVMGWGLKDNQELSNMLLKGAVRPILRARCQARFDEVPHNKLKLSENQFCALGDKDEEGTFTDSCKGDSGGPLVLERGGKCYLVGITSTGSGCGSEFFAGVYVKVTKYLKWIINKNILGR